MPFNDDNAKALYSAVSKDYDVGSYGDFVSKLSNQDNRQALFNQIGQEYDLGDFKGFNQRLGFPTDQTVKLSDTPVTQNQPQQNTNVNFNQLNARHGKVGGGTEQKNIADYGENIGQDKIDLRNQSVDNTLQRKYKNTGVTVAKNSPKYKKDFQQTLNALNNGDIVQTRDKDGNPTTTRGAGFLESTGNALIESFKAPVEAWKINTLSGKELADYLDQKRNKEPDVPESLPSGVLGNLGEAAGAFPKIAGLFGLNEVAPGLGTTAASAEAQFSSTGKQTEQLYNQQLNELTKQGIPYEKARLIAADNAKKNAPLAALPDAAMTAMLGEMGVDTKALSESADNFKTTLLKSGKSVAKMGLLGGGSEAGRSGIEKAQGYDVKMQDVLDNFGKGAFQWATLDGMFKLAPIINSLPSAVRTSWKDYMSNVPAQLRVNGLDAETNKDITDYSTAKQTVPDNYSDDQRNALAQLIQKKNELTNNANEHFKTDDEKRIENLDKAIGYIQKGGNPDNIFMDDLTGELSANPKAYNGITTQEKESIDVPKEYGKAETEQVASGEEKKFKPTAYFNETKEGRTLKQPIEFDDKTYTDKSKAQEVADKALKKHYYENGMQDFEKPQRKSANAVPEEKPKEEPQAEVIQPKGVEGNQPSDEHQPTEEIGVAETKPIEPTQEPTENKVADNNKQEDVGENIQGDNKVVNYEDATKISHSISLDNLPKGIDEKSREARSQIVRDRENTPPTFEKHPIGTYAVDKYGEAYQLQELPIKDIITKSEGTQREETVSKYAKWQKETGEILPVKGVENYAEHKGKVVITDGQHRVLAAKQNGNETIPVWVALTDPKNHARPLYEKDIPVHSKEQGVQESDTTKKPQGTESQAPKKEQQKPEKQKDNSVVGDAKVEESKTPIKDAFKNRINNVDEKSKQSDVSKLGVGDYANKPAVRGESSQVTGFVKKIGRTNVVLDTFYQLGSTEDDGIMQEITVKKSDIKEFYKPKEAEKKPINTETNAIPEHSTGEVLQRQQGVESSEQGNETPEEKSEDKGKEENVGVYTQRPPTQLSHQGEDKLVTEFGGDNYFESPERKRRIALHKEADNLIANGVTAPKLMSALENGDKKFLSDAEHVVLVRYADALANKLRQTDINSPEWNRLLQERNKVINASSGSGTEAARALGARNISIGGEDADSYGNFMSTELDANNEAPMTNKQKEDASADFNKLQKDKEQFEKDKQAFEANVAKFKAEQAAAKLQKTSKKSERKTHEERVAYRKSEIEKAREALKNLRPNELSSTIPFAQQVRELIAIAPHVKNVLGDLLEEGALKLADAIDKVYEDFKEFGVSKTDIHNIIAGEYDEKKKITRKEASIRMEDLRIEAQLMNKLESLIKDGAPKNEKTLRKRTAEIEDLKKRIKDFKKEDKEANKFYGESDAAERRIQAKEDELQRLKDRKEKEPKETVKREISAREQQLNKEIQEERKAFNKEKTEANKFYKEEYDGDFKKLQALKKRNESEINKIKEVIKKGDFSPEVKKTPILHNKEYQSKFPTAFKALQKSNDELIKTRHDIALRRAKWMYEHRTDKEKTFEVISKSLNIPRTLMTIGDFSAVLRQAAVATAAHPVIASKALKFMFEAAADEKIYNRWLDEVHNDPLWSEAEKSKLPITDPSSLRTKEHEEAYYGSQYAEKIPVVGGVVKASERAYNGYLNFIRWEMFKMYANEFSAKGKTYDNNPELYKGISSFIGSSTGRGGMRFGESASPVLNAVLFASRLIASRVNMLGLTDIPNLLVRGVTLGHHGVDFGFYTKLPPAIRVRAAADMLKFVGVGIATLALAQQMGAQVELDPRSSDFGKIHDGKTRWDIWGGFQPYARLISQIVSGQSKSANTGKVYELDGSKYGSRTVGDQIVTFGRGKFSPIVGTGADIFVRRTLDQQTLDRRFDIPFYSKDNSPQGHITLTDELLKEFTPLIANDIREAMQDRGISALYTVGIPSLFGIGVQTYQPKPVKEEEVKGKGEVNHYIKPPSQSSNHTVKRKG